MINISILSIILPIMVVFLFLQGNKTRNQRIENTLQSDENLNNGNKVKAKISNLANLNNINFPKLLSFSLLIIIVAFNAFIYNSVDTSRFPVVAVGLYNVFLTVAIMLSIKKSKHGFLTFSVATLSIFSSAFLSVRANGFVQGVNLIVMNFSVFLLYFINTYDHITWKGMWLFKNILNLVPHTFRQIPSILNRSASAKKEKQSDLVSTFKTILITSVVLIFFVVLLTSADPVFASMIENFMGEIIGRVVSSLVLAVIVILFLTQRAKSDFENYWKLGFFSVNDLFVPAVALVTLFALFLSIQVNYLFGSEVNLEVFNLTYSEYVRKGFIELLTTAFFGGLLAYIVVMKSRLVDSVKEVTKLKIVNTVLILELFMMLASALKRDIMYVEAYGLTRVRIIGGVFLFWLAGLLLMLLVLNLYKKIQEQKFVGGLVLLSVMVLFYFNFVNMDQMVVNGAPEHHTYKDYFYINNLSEDGYKGWGQSITDIELRSKLLLEKESLSDQEKSQLAGDKLSLISLQEKRVSLMKKYASQEWLETNFCDELKFYECKNGELKDSVIKNRGWQFDNVSEKKAYEEIFNNQDLYFSKVDEILNAINFYQLENNLSLKLQEKWFLNEFTYPFISIDLNYYPKDPKFIKFDNNPIPNTVPIDEYYRIIKND